MDLKIRYDFITNSSSTSFVLAAKEVAGVLVGSALIAQAVYSANKAASDAVSAKDIATATGTVVASPLIAEMFRLSDTDDLQSLDSKEEEVRRQLGAYKKQHSESKSGTDAAADAATDAAYDDYFDYLYKKLDQISSAKFIKIISSARENAEEQAKKDWIASKQEELKDILDEKAFLQSEAENSEAASEMLKEISKSESEIRQSLADSGAEAYQAPEVEVAASRYSPTDEACSKSFENALSRDYLLKKSGVTNPIASESLETEAMKAFTSHSAKSMKALYSGSDTSEISPEMMKWIRKGLFSFVNNRFGGKYANQSKNLFSIADSSFTEDSSGLADKALDVAKSDILSNSFTSLAVDKDAKELFDWQGLLKYIRDRKPLEKVVKTDLSAEGQKTRRYYIRKGC